VISRPAYISKFSRGELIDQGRSFEQRGFRMFKSTQLSQCTGRGFNDSPHLSAQGTDGSSRSSAIVEIEAWNLIALLRSFVIKSTRYLLQAQPMPDMTGERKPSIPPFYPGRPAFKEVPNAQTPACPVRVQPVSHQVHRVPRFQSLDKKHNRKHHVRPMSGTVECSKQMVRIAARGGV
jgi:hypothetical protein